MIRLTTPISWYVPRFVLNRQGVSFQIHWRWRGGGRVPVFVLTMWFKRPLRLRRLR